MLHRNLSNGIHHLLSSSKNQLQLSSLISFPTNFITTATTTAPKAKPKVTKPAKLSKPTIPSLREVTPAEVRKFNKDGYLFIRTMFTTEEMNILKQTIEHDPLVNAKKMEMKDASGLVSNLTLWSNVPYHTTYGTIAAGRRMVHASNKLMGEPVYHFHTKIMLKEPKKGGAWNIHQE